MSPDVSSLKAYLGGISRRLLVLSALRGAAFGLSIAFVIVLVTTSMRWSRATAGEMIPTALWIGVVGLVVGLIGAIIGRSRRRDRHVATEVERRAPACRNVVVTAAELLDERTIVAPYVGEAVFREAAEQVRRLDRAKLFPAKPVVAALTMLVVTWAITLGVITAHSLAPSTAFSLSPDATPPTVEGVDVVVTPPAYSGRPSQTLRDPARIDALAGSRLGLTVRANARSVALETLRGRDTLSPVSQNRFAGSVLADVDGFIAVEPSAVDGQVGARRLIGLSVTPDRSPRVRITAPGKDLMLADGRRTIDVAIDADDDLGLASLVLRYTKVSGSGEKFTFTEGEVPLTISRTDNRSWKARGAPRLAALNLEPGDIVVYRGVATDKRPGAPPTESDAFIVEITSPGMIASEGFAMDDRQDKYALSQQMVILKTERLIAKASAMAVDSLRYQAQMIAAEQRSVRAEFVFMMGGELAEEVIAAAGLTDLNEEAEAAGEADLAAGRMLNRGRVALVQAIRFMSRASSSLNSTELAIALREEKAALTYLQQAFSRTRYLLRALTQRERLDLSRRLTGVLATAARDSRPLAEAAADPRLVALRRTLSAVATIAADTAFGPGVAATTSTLAQRVLEVDPSATALQKVANGLSAGARAMSERNNGEARRLVGDAALELAAIIRGGLKASPGPARPPDVRRLQGELSDALRRTGLDR